MSSFTHLSVYAVVLVVLCLTNPAAGARMINVELVINTDSTGSNSDSSPPKSRSRRMTSSRSACVGGNVGVTNASVLVQYRLYNATLPTHVKDWVFLAEVNVSGSVGEYPLFMQFELPRNCTAEGLQLRFLQLEHGGEECNCWGVGQMTLEYLDPPESSATLYNGGNIDSVECYNSGRNEQNFCAGFANEARGVITQVFFFTNSPGNIMVCPGDSSDVLLSPEVLPENCSTRTPHM